MSVVYFGVECALKRNTRYFTDADASNRTLNIGVKRNPLFSSAPPNFSARSSAGDSQTRGTHGRVRICVPMTGGSQRRAQISRMHRTGGRKCNVHPRLHRARQPHIPLTCGLSERNFRQSAPTGTFGIVYGVPITTFHRALRMEPLLSGVPAPRRANQHPEPFAKSIVSAAFYYFILLL